METPGDDIVPASCSPESSPPSEPAVAPGTLAPESAPPPPFYQRPALRTAAVVFGVVLFLVAIGLLLPSPFWRF